MPIKTEGQREAAHGEPNVARDWHGRTSRIVLRSQGTATECHGLSLSDPQHCPWLDSSLSPVLISRLFLVASPSLVAPSLPSLSGMVIRNMQHMELETLSAAAATCYLVSTVVFPAKVARQKDTSPSHLMLGDGNGWECSQ